MNIEIDEIQNEEISVLNWIRKVKPKHITSIVPIKWAASIATYMNNLQLDSLDQFQGEMEKYFDEHLNEDASEEDIEVMAYSITTRILSLGYDSCLAKEEQKTQLAAEKMERKLSNRAKYQMETVLRREGVMADGEIIKTRWNGTTDLKAGGLMRLAIEHKLGKQEQPPVFAIQNNLPMQTETRDDGTISFTRPEINPEEWTKMMESNIIISGERLGWLRTSPAWRWLKHLFPKVIDCRAYNHSLNAPVLPGGFMADVPVKLTTIKTINQQGEEISAETDGCGRIHPDHPLFKQLERPGGICVIQFRFINLKGLFVKGILVPDERCVSADGEPEIWFDWMQVKGRNKADAKQRAENNDEILTTGYIGIIQAWDRPRTLKWSFEQLQMFKLNPETCNIIEEWVEEAYENLLGEGINSLLTSIAADNPQLRLVLQLADKVSNYKPEFSVTQIQMVRNAMIERLQRTLYFIAQGAGKHGKQMVAVIDNGIPEGYIVAAGYKPGSEVVVHRYPTLLPQAMMKLTVMAPLPHHKVDGKVVRYAIYMNSRDLTDKAQGDSDGDIMGITADPRVLQLMEHRIGDNRVFMVEPEGHKFETLTDSPEGLLYMSGNPRGNVGGMCLHQARMFAIGDYEAAVAMAFPYQEAVDLAKKKMIFTDWREATDFSAWTEKNGRYYFHKPLSKAEYSGDNLPEEMIRNWINGRLKYAGITDPKAQNAIAWRRGNKRINPNNWEKCALLGNWEGGNLVHYCHDIAQEIWQRDADQFDFDVEIVDISNILGMLLKSINIKFTPMQISWRQYLVLRQNSGLREFGQEMRKAMQSDTHEEDRQQRINTALINLNGKLQKLNVAEMECIWRMELSDTFSYGRGDSRYYTNEPPPDCKTQAAIEEARVNNPNLAFRAVASPASIIMNLLDIEHAESCPFLEGENAHRITTIISRAIADENPEKKLTEMIFNSKLHAEKVKNSAGEAIHGRDCPHCTATLHNSLIRELRKERRTAEYGFIRVLVSYLNK